jgi:hypothetical protein
VILRWKSGSGAPGKYARHLEPVRARDVRGFYTVQSRKHARSGDLAALSGPKSGPDRGSCSLTRGIGSVPLPCLNYPGSGRMTS